MTAKTSEELAQVLHAAGLFDLEAKARRDEYHDFLSDAAMPSLQLVNDLDAALDAAIDPDIKRMIRNIHERHCNGEFDASKEESDEWAASPDGMIAFRLLFGRKDGK